MELSDNKLILAAVAALVLLLLLAGTAFLLWRRRSRSRSKYGFRPEADSMLGTSIMGDSRLSVYSEADEFVRRRGQRVADVLIDYAAATGQPGAVYSARLGAESVVWWVGEKYPSSNKGVVAAVHAGRRPTKGFRIKVVVLQDAAQGDALAAALKRAARPNSGPLMHDSWGAPIAFQGFPLRPDAPVQVVQLASPAGALQPPEAAAPPAPPA